MTETKAAEPTTAKRLRILQSWLANNHNELYAVDVADAIDRLLSLSREVEELKAHIADWQDQQRAAMKARIEDQDAEIAALKAKLNRPRANTVPGVQDWPEELP